MTRLGTLNQVDHLHKGSPRHCVIHSQWLLVSLTRQNPSGLAIPTQPNLLSKLHLNRWELVFRVSTWDTSWKLAAGRTPGNLDGPKKRHFSPVEPSKIGVLQCFVGIFRTPWIDRSITKFPGPLLRSRVAAVAATVWQTFTAAGFVIRRWVCRKI